MRLFLAHETDLEKNYGENHVFPFLHQTHYSLVFPASQAGIKISREKKKVCSHHQKESTPLDTEQKTEKKNPNKILLYFLFLKGNLALHLGLGVLKPAGGSVIW